MNDINTTESHDTSTDNTIDVQALAREFLGTDDTADETITEHTEDTENHSQGTEDESSEDKEETPPEPSKEQEQKERASKRFAEAARIERIARKKEAEAKQVLDAYDRERPIIDKARAFDRAMAKDPIAALQEYYGYDLAKIAEYINERLEGEIKDPEREKESRLERIERTLAEEREERARERQEREQRKKQEETNNNKKADIKLVDDILSSDNTDRWELLKDFDPTLLASYNTKATTAQEAVLEIAYGYMSQHKRIPTQSQIMQWADNLEAVLIKETQKRAERISKSKKLTSNGSARPEQKLTSGTQKDARVRTLSNQLNSGPAHVERTLFATEDDLINHALAKLPTGR